MQYLTAHGGIQRFCSPEKQINETGEFHCYNEMDYLYVQSGKKIKPDYIIAFRKNGEIANIKFIKQAATDWGGELPIVIIDVNECLKEQKRQIDELLNLYNLQKTPELAQKIIQKIKNNRKSTKNREPFYEDSLIKQLETYLEQNKGGNQVTKEDLAINSGLVTPQERQEGPKVMKRILQQIRTIAEKRDEDNSER